MRGFGDLTVCLDKWQKKGWWGAITVYPEPYHYWQWACKYYPVLLNPLHGAVLTHLPEAPTFTSGFAGAWAGVAESGKALIYKADSGLVRWARWPKGPRSDWPAEMLSCGPWRGIEWQAESCEAKLRGFHRLAFFLLCFSSLHALSDSLRRSPDENFTNHLRINRDSDNTTSNSPFTATGATRGPKRHRRTPAMNTSACVCVCVWAQTGSCQCVSWSR